MVNVHSGNKANVQSFDELIIVEYHRKDSVLLLPPTTHTIANGHICRWWYLYKKLSSLLDHEYDFLKPVDYAWEYSDDDIVPVKHLNLLPDKFCKICACKNPTTEEGCKSNRCVCHKAGLKCTGFCKCLKCSNNDI